MRHNMENNLIQPYRRMSAYQSANHRHPDDCIAYILKLMTIRFCLLVYSHERNIFVNQTSAI